MSDQETLNQLGVITRKRNPRQSIESLLETIATAYPHAMVMLSSNQYRLESLLDENGQSKLLTCQRDNPNAWVIVNGSSYQSREMCKRCTSCMVCVTDLRTRSFQFIGKGGVKQKVSLIDTMLEN